MFFTLIFYRNINKGKNIKKQARPRKADKLKTYKIAKVVNIMNMIIFYNDKFELLCKLKSVY